MPERDYGERELAVLKDVLASKELGSLGGKVTPRFEAAFAKAIGSAHGVAMNCAMSVLHTSLQAAGAGAGTEVICDPVFVFGALAALYANAVPRFVDINADTHNMDPDKLEAAVTDRTRAVIATHAWGLPAQIDRIVEIAHRHNLIVVEDCAHSILATYKGRCTGRWGDIGSFSFQGSKQMSLGDGGMATTDSDELARKLGLNAGAPTFLSVAHGLHYNYRMNELTSAVGLAQLEKLPAFVEGLKRNASFYEQAIESCEWLVPQRNPEACSSYHFWAARFEGERCGLELAEFKRLLKESESTLSMGYTQMPAYRHPVIKDRLAHAFHCSAGTGQIEYPDGLCPVAERTIPRILLSYTVVPESAAQQDAEKLAEIVAKVGK